MSLRVRPGQKLPRPSPLRTIAWPDWIQAWPGWIHQWVHAMPGLPEQRDTPTAGARPKQQPGFPDRRAPPTAGSRPMEQLGSPTMEQLGSPTAGSPTVGSPTDVSAPLTSVSGRRPAGHQVYERGPKL
jgi:hypothetical protein